MDPLKTLDAALLALASCGFDRDTHESFVARAATASDNAVRGQLAPVPDAQVPALPPLGTAERERLRLVGEQLIRERRVGVVVLAGGMATRFGGVVKAVVPARGAASFLQLKHADIAAVATQVGAPIPLFVMSSFATHDVIAAHIAQHALSTAAVPMTVFPQLAALRLGVDGSLFHDAKGELSPYATGHGDLTFALRASGTLKRFRDAGGTTLCMTNVDNLGATLDPAMLALHHELGGAVTVEVVRKLPGAVGGAPALLDGVPQIIEGFRFPRGYDQDQIKVFNTNTLILDAAAIDRDFALPYYRVEKKVDGVTVLQFERLVGELTAFLPSRFVQVEQSGPDCRFLPIKEPEDLERHRSLIDRVVTSPRAVRQMRPDEV
ncbi:MAG TPA: UTP--glucose-1-phosphate uridylyltransferase [Kofleriaceae bacterium]|nr:UTP--glucose-1-phosphate uridylyltransferase [Kofleriaceae bacterium]